MPQLIQALLLHPEFEGEKNGNGFRTKISTYSTNWNFNIFAKFVEILFLFATRP